MVLQKQGFLGDFRVKEQFYSCNTFTVSFLDAPLRRYLKKKIPAVVEGLLVFRHLPLNKILAVVEGLLVFRHLPLNKIPAVVEGLLVFRRDIGLTAGILFLRAPLTFVAQYLRYAEARLREPLDAARQRDIDWTAGIFFQEKCLRTNRRCMAAGHIFATFGHLVLPQELISSNLLIGKFLVTWNSVEFF